MAGLYGDQVMKGGITRIIVCSFYPNGFLPKVFSIKDYLMETNDNLTKK
jgi:hypothetical protein